MRTISDSGKAILSGKTGIESVVVVKVQWNKDGGNVMGYADRDIPGIADGRILELGGLESVTRIDGEGSTMSVNVKLSDTDGSLKNIFNTTDIHKSPVSFYQGFYVDDTAELFLIGSGIIHSPIEWSEGSRTLSFTVMSRLESWETGFSAEEGHFPAIAQNLIGTPWPMVFGTVTHSPTLQLQEIPTFFTMAPFGVADPSLIAQTAAIGAHIAALQRSAQLDLLYAAFACFEVARQGSSEATSSTVSASGDDDTGVLTLDIHETTTSQFKNLCNDDSTVQGFNQAAAQAQEEANQEQVSLNELSLTYSNQVKWQVPVEIVANVNVTQSYSGVFKVGNQLFNGKIGFVNASTNLPETGMLDPKPILYDPYPGMLLDGQGNPIPGDTGPIRSQSQILKQGFQFYNAGTQVTIAGPYPIAYMVSMIPGTVLAVYAFRSFNGLRHLTAVPKAYYTVQNVNYGVIETVQVILNMPLSVVAWHENESISNWENSFGQYLPSHIVSQIDWEDTLYVTFQSSVGPNPVDIISYIIGRWCPGMGIDATSFGIARAQANHFSMNFTLSARPQAIELITELAYQCNCAVWVDEDIFHIKYLPAQADSVDTLTEDDIVVDSLSITTSESEGLVTKYVATYRPDYSPVYDTPVKLILRFNIAKYGVHEESHDFYAFNNYWEVEKGAQYWFIRKSQTWKLLNVKAVMTKLALETWDTVDLAFSHPYVANGTVPGIVQSATYDSSDNTCQLSIWVPVRAGEMTQFEFAFPANASENVYWPVVRDIASGGGGGLSEASGQLPSPNSISYQIKFPGSSSSDRNYKLFYYIGPPGDPDEPGRPDSDPFPGTQVDGANRSRTGNPQPQKPATSTNETKPVDGPTPVTPPTFKYDYKDLIDPNTVIGEPPSRSYPCKITGYKGKTDSGLQLYEGILYKRGLKNDGTPFVGAQLQIDDNDRIPPDTWTHVIVTVWSEDKKDDGSSASSPGLKGPDGKPLSGVQNKNYLMAKTIQLPVWLQ